MSDKLPLDFVLAFCKDKIPGHGEDSFCYSFCDTAGILGAFDGCGGAGAKKHEYYSGNTEAFMASRLCAGAFFDTFLNMFPTQAEAEKLANEAFGPNAVNWLQAFQPPKDPNGFRITGSLVRTLPTTAAVALLRQVDSGAVEVCAMWAGDSRVYVLDETGLAQLTVDDTNVPDPMENLYEDGVLKNIFCTDREVKLHCKTVQVKLPCMVFAATDGCFGYVSTPMEFEGMLIHTLLNADTPIQWESSLAEMIGSTAGDDHTMCMAVLGYNSFTSLQKVMSRRYAHILEKYLNPVSQMPQEDRQSRISLWDTYRANYMRYLKDGQT